MKDNGRLQSLFFAAIGAGIDAQTRITIAEVFEYNVTLTPLALNFATPYLAEDGLFRNQELVKQRQAFTCISRCSTDIGLLGLEEKYFRNVIFKSFLPPLCRRMPLELTHCANICERV